jgi:hypothetical protein
MRPVRRYPPGNVSTQFGRLSLTSAVFAAQRPLVGLPPSLKPLHAAKVAGFCLRSRATCLSAACVKRRTSR